ncbi:GntR family transcriptional regulator [Streptomyces sp. NPDC093111]|uniref:GntR family transcriptional regulator n=1 Tax=Streptomyces sp. NPDC093111 TaxID=3154978 RepID=UPI00342FC5FB
MTTATTALAAEDDSLAPPTILRLRSALLRVRHVAKDLPYRSTSQIEQDREKVWALVEPWVPLAETRLQQAADSPSDRTRWQECIAGVQRPGAEGVPVPRLVNLGNAAICLLHALIEAEAAGPGVKVITDYVRTAITTGRYLPGTRLGPGRVADELALGRSSLIRVELAFQDLCGEGLVTFSSPGKWWVTVHDRPVQIAALLRTLIRAGVYPPETHLPSLVPLARALVSSAPDVSAALRTLQEEGAVIRGSWVRPTVHPAPPFRVQPPCDPDVLVDRLRDVVAPDADLSPFGIRMACKQAQGWWRARISPEPTVLEHTRRCLTAATVHLIEQGPDDREAHTRLRRAATLVLAGTSSDYLWRTACLAVVVLEILDSTGGGA